MTHCLLLHSLGVDDMLTLAAVEAEDSQRLVKARRNELSPGWRIVQIESVLEGLTWRRCAPCEST